MKLLFVFVVVLIASASLALLVQKDPGYVLLSYDAWSAETTLAFLIIMIIALYVALHYLLRLISGLWNFRDRILGWSNRRKVNRARGNLHLGLLALAEGHWKMAERYLVRRIKSSEAPVLNYLGAARAAQQMGNLDKRDQYLLQAQQCSDTADLAVGLTQAELQIAQGQLEQALASLNSIGKIGRKNHYVLNLLKNIFLEFKDWQSLHEMLPELRKYHVMNEPAIEQLEIRIHTNLIQLSGKKNDLESLRSTWAGMPKALRKNEDILLAYTRYLVALDAGDEAEGLLRKSLKKNWSQPLVLQYGLTKGGNSHKQLTCAEAWNKQHNNDPVLLLTLGRLCKRNQELEKAREYLKSSIKIEPATETYRVLGELLESCGDKEAAMRSYRQGMLLTPMVKDT